MTRAFLEFDGGWLAALRARADQPPLCPRAPLLAGGSVVGSILPDLLHKIGPQPTSHIHSLLLKEEFLVSGHEPGLAWRIQGDVSTTLHLLAEAMRDANIGHVARYWRDEALAVNNAQGLRLGHVERGAVRTLGIATRAVHLVGWSPDGRIWVQQRALDKANDPGLWDTLMGGMVPAQDTVETALARETWEEAGLHLDALHAVQRGGTITVRRPTGEPGDDDDSDSDDDGIGYMVEDTDWYHCTVPDGMVPVNQDGEVAQFLLLETDELMARLHRNEFTLEAALVLVAALGATSL
jgi:8-oxo-dGTP pyrophosphatase MutT (NUDIX family)